MICKSSERLPLPRNRISPRGLVVHTTHQIPQPIKRVRTNPPTLLGVSDPPPARRLLRRFLGGGGGRGGGGPPRTARQFDDVPLNVVFGEPVSQNRGPRLDSPCRLFCWLGLPASCCRKSGKTQCFWTSSLRKRWKNRVFLREILGSKGEVQGDIHTYIHTLQYITLHYITLHCHYMTLHTYIHYIHTYIHA